MAGDDVAGDDMAEDVERLEAVDRASLASAISLICGDPALAEEALQEALLRAWQKVKAGGEVASWPAWVVTVALNHTRNHFRRLGRERAALRRLANQLEPMQHGEFTDRIASSVDLVRAMSSLTRRDARWSHCTTGSTCPYRRSPERCASTRAP